MRNQSRPAERLNSGGDSIQGKYKEQEKMNDISSLSCARLARDTAVDGAVSIFPMTQPMSGMREIGKNLDGLDQRVQEAKKLVQKTEYKVDELEDSIDQMKKAEKGGGRKS
jgi:hypothetical protein